MRKQLTYIILGISLFLQAQEGDYFMSIKRYPFIQYNQNEIIFPSGVNSFTPLYEKLDSMMLYGNGKLNIVHFGGSHIQADIYTHQIRERLQSLEYDMNGGRGLIFPYRVAKTNNPWNYKVRYMGDWSYDKNTKRERSGELGLTGISVTTASNYASITINPNPDSTSQYSFNQIRVFHSETNYQLTLSIGNAFYEGVYDSAGGYTAYQVEASSEFKLNFQRADTLNEDVTLYGIELLNDDHGIVYNSIGVNGAKLESYLSCDLLEQQLAVVKPDLIIFSIGTNDANVKHFNKEKFYTEYQALIKRTLRAAPHAKILITVPNDAYYYKRYVNKNTIPMRNEIIKLAKNNNYAVWDFFDIMGGLNSSQLWYNYGIMKYDRIHFNRDGYLLKGDLFVTAFLRGWEEKLAARSQQYFYKERLSEIYQPQIKRTE